MDNLVNQRFDSGLQLLSTKVVAFDYNNKLSSLDAIRMLLNDTPSNKVAPLIKTELKQPKEIEQKNGSEIKDPAVINENKLSEDA
jgi:hypothetical protein